MATVTVNVQANTGEATQDINKLNSALNQTEQTADDLSSSLEKQEARIKTLGGAINIVGGSVEILAGSLAAAGALTEEQTERFEAAAVGAIAFADGTKRVFEGYKELGEGLKAYGGISGVATKATKALNTAVRANPYVAVATAIAAVTAAIVVYIKSQKDEKAELESGNKSYERRLELLKQTNRQYFNAEEQLAILEEGAKSRNRTILEEAAAEKQRAKEAKDRAEKDIRLVEDAIAVGRVSREESEAQLEVLQRNRDEADKYYKQVIAAEILYGKQQEQSNQKSAEAAKKLEEQKIAARDARLEQEGLLQVIQQTTDEIIDSLNLFRSTELDGPLEVIEEIDEAFEDLGDTIFFTKEQLDEFNKAEEVLIDQSFEARRERLATYYDDLIKQAASNASEVEQLERAKNKALGDLDKQRSDEQKKNIEDAAKATLATTINLLATIRETTDDGTKEGFEKSKKFRIAETRLSSIQAAFDAYKSLVGVPIVGPVLAVAAAATALAAGQKAISDIKSSSFEGGGSPTNPSSGAATSGARTAVAGGLGAGAGIFGAPTLPIPTGGGAPAVPTTVDQTPAVRAYVLAGDVTDGISANRTIERRRTLTTG